MRIIDKHINVKNKKPKDLFLTSLYLMNIDILINLRNIRKLFFIYGMKKSCKKDKTQ
ncbi:conserved hypothetical protein [Rickettsia prowazekii str. Rp22]|uniref:Uncharacterized protein n=1 Tax=Rickettsia prowazekii (strain Rp22) TaxID=449216 RepID=D5AXW4_RICPP|nr:conserved hypothetical protein [Rickettsia prowazekii str. Rp22]